MNKKHFFDILGPSRVYDEEFISHTIVGDFVFFRLHLVVEEEGKTTIAKYTLPTIPECNFGMAEDMLIRWLNDWRRMHGTPITLKLQLR